MREFKKTVAKKIILCGKNSSVLIIKKTISN